MAINLLPTHNVTTHTIRQPAAFSRHRCCSRLCGPSLYPKNRRASSAIVLAFERFLNIEGYFDVCAFVVSGGNEAKGNTEGETKI
jgi:hypothetical protein